MKKTRYVDAGVDIAAASEAKKRISGIVKSTHGASVLGGIGGFGGLFSMEDLPHDPILVSSIDGVGTKLKLAFLLGRHSTVGIDLVNHCVNDILVQGARPLFFLDYLATGRLEPGVVEEVVEIRHLESCVRITRCYHHPAAGVEKHHHWPINAPQEQVQIYEYSASRAARVLLEAYRHLR